MAGGDRTAAAERRENLRKDFWSDEDAWTGEGEKGWFRAPRTLPLLLGLLGEKDLRGNQDLTRVYVELFARHMGSGVIEMGIEGDHAFAAGYVGTRAVRTWRERMRTLEKLGFIRTKRAGNQDFKYVLLVHPTSIIKKLYDAGKVPDEWWTTYRGRQSETKEATHEMRAAAKRGRNMVRLVKSAVKGPVVAKA